MAGLPYVAARTFQGGHTFAREVLGLSRGQYRILTTPGTIKSIRGVDLHLSPDWKKRYDVHAIRTALRWTRMHVVEWTEESAQEFLASRVGDGLTPPGEQLVLDGAPPAPEAPPSPPAPLTLVAEPVEAEAKARRTRRRRCSECGILVEPADVEAHAAEHLPTEPGGE